ncbi:AAA family ATPase [Kineococcus rhizosphaerae]|uniref:AAA domain-containing protein n=1 Tax=Kineococcus rhizosphaerae TaxID=559628 RepID=A0A2T0QLQ7_9ACTN|nr:AAA family ATPase [Kineococcus rhizosphaerae]PRY05317.1 AAA domain-containing protein [Kineococcus rhizosphaerae]
MEDFDELREQTNRYPAFVIPHLLVRGLNLWYGPPKSNKTGLATALVYAALTGRSFLGGQLTNADGAPTFTRVVILISEIGGERDYTQWLEELGLTSARHLQVITMSRPWTLEEWGDLAQALEADEETLIILDNLSASTDGSVTRDEDVKPAIQGMGQCLRSRAVGLILGHATNSAMTEGGKPLGSTYIESAVRWLVEIRKPTKRDDTFCELSARGNWGRSHKQTLERGERVAEWSVVDTKDADTLSREAGETRKAKQRKTADRNAEIADAVVANCQGMTKKETAAWISEQRFPGGNGGTVSAATAEKNLSGDGKQYGSLLDHAGGKWSRRG